MQINSTERYTGLCQSRFQRAKIADAGCSARLSNNGGMQVQDFTKRQVPHQASRLYSSLFFSRTRAAA
jgi:hypothetical protein